MSTTLKARTTVVTLFQGDDLDPITERAKDVKKVAESTIPRRIGDGDPALTEASKSFDDFMDDATGRAVLVGLAALPRKVFGALRAEHPPRMVADLDPDAPEGAEVVHGGDARAGFNQDTLGDALVPVCMKRYWKIADELAAAAAAAGDEAAPPDVTRFESDEAIAEFLDDLADGDWAKVYSAAVMLNQSMGPDPKVRLSSHLAQTSDETSTSPARLA